MKQIQGKQFEYFLNGRVYIFKIIGVTQKAVRLKINNSSQNIWIPKAFLIITDSEIIPKNLSWKLMGWEFQHKVNLIDARNKNENINL